MYSNHSIINIVIDNFVCVCVCVYNDHDYYNKCMGGNYYLTKGQS